MLWYTQINCWEEEYLYIKFVTDKTNLKEARVRSVRTNTPVDTDECLHLYHLSGSVYVVHMADTYNVATRECLYKNKQLINSQDVQKLVPEKNEAVMVVFPYKDIGRRVNAVGSDLGLFGNMLFGFSDTNTYLHSIDYQSQNRHLQGFSYQKAVITVLDYKKLKNNLKAHDVWWNCEHLSICTQWLLRNPSSSVTDAFDVIRSDIVTIVTNFYNLMMDQTGSFTRSKDAWQIHRFLSLRKALLQNRFLFFEQNVGNTHWMSSCMCNPWFSVLQWKRKKPGAELTEALESVDEN